MRKKIIYIAGYSRSGSTILDILLSSHPGIFGTGELGYFFRDWMDNNRKCTCGNNYCDCPFWKNYKLAGLLTFEQANDLLCKIESRSNLNKLTNNELTRQDIEKYTLLQTSLYNYISNTSGKNVIVDSSKTARDMAGRFYALNKYTEFDVYVIHLVKNGLSIVESYVSKGANWALEGYHTNNKFLGARSTVGWLLANKIAVKLGKKIPAEKYLRLRYEDLITDPKTALTGIGNFIKEDLSQIIDDIKLNKSFHAQHNVGGNRLRLEKEIQFTPTEKVKEIKLSVFYRLLFQFLAGALNKKFGYKVN